MWPRVVEVALGCWLMMSPFVFRHTPESTSLWVNDLVCGALVALLGLFSFWSRTRYAHLGLLGVSLWLVAHAYLAPHPLPPALQNDLIVGILLLMFAIVPSEASLPPRPWRDLRP